MRSRHVAFVLGTLSFALSLASPASAQQAPPTDGQPKPEDKGKDNVVDAEFVDVDDKK